VRKKYYPMKIDIQMNGGEKSKSLHQIVTRSLKALTEINESVTEADVKFKSLLGDAYADKVCEIYLKVGERNIFAIQKGRTFEKSAMKTIEKLQGHLEKMK
jgi:hypothetical protein